VQGLTPLATSDRPCGAFGTDSEDKIKKISVRSSVGSHEQRVRLGRIGVRVPGLASRSFSWACHFVEPPHAPHMALLGLEGVLKDLRLVFDGTYSFENPCGVLVLEMTSA
ncbi:MAG TPA: hypothetical protein VFF52_14120, partial [Isosphaeraceae bacterium]|nr:hypothetical protein [Isosphaeraceae bacterium]